MGWVVLLVVFGCFMLVVGCCSWLLYGGCGCFMVVVWFHGCIFELLRVICLLPFQRQPRFCWLPIRGKGIAGVTSRGEKGGKPAIYFERTVADCATSLKAYLSASGWFGVVPSRVPEGFLGLR